MTRNVRRAQAVEASLRQWNEPRGKLSLNLVELPAAAKRPLLGCTNHDGGPS